MTPVAGADLAPAPLRIGTSGDYPPFSTESDGTYGGFDVEVARAYAKDRGREVEFVPFRWPDLESELLAGEFDAAMSGVTVRGDRLARAPMTAAAVYADAVLVLRPGRTVDQLGAEGVGLVVGVNRGGHLERVARAELPRARIVPLDDNRKLRAALDAGEVDAIVTDSAEAAALFSPTPPRGRAQARSPIAAVLERDRKAYWVSPKEAALGDDLDVWLRIHEETGELAAMRARHGIPAWPRDVGALDWTLGVGGAPARRRAPAEPTAAAARVADLIARRLMLMPIVAEAKRSAKLPVADPTREVAVEHAARAAAAAIGLDADAYAALVREQIEAAKRVQEAVLALPPREPPAPADSAAVPIAPPDLKRDLRPAIDRIDEALLAELARSAPVAASAPALAELIRAWSRVPGLDEAGAIGLAEAALAVPGANREAALPGGDAAPGTP